jgi:hypothetical protein
MYIRPQHSTEPSDIEEHVCPKVAEMVVGAFALAPLLSNMKAQTTPLTILRANVLPLLASAADARADGGSVAACWEGGPSEDIARCAGQ